MVQSSIGPLPLLLTSILAWKLLPQPSVPVISQFTLPPPEPEELLELLDDEELEELLEPDIPGSVPSICCT